MPVRSTQRERARKVLAGLGMVRLYELRAAGIIAATVCRMEHDGVVVRFR